MKHRRVKITGIGPITPAGIGRDEFWKGILEPVSRVKPFTKIGEEFGPFVAACVEGFDAEKYLSRKLMPKMAARHTQFAVAGAILALRDAGISQDELRESRAAIVTGSCVMDFGGVLNSVDAVLEKGNRGALPRVLYTVGVGSVPSGINQALGLTARTVALSNQCSSGLDAIGYAASLVANGEVDMAICGGTDAPLHRFPLIELRAADLTPTTTELFDKIARPFDLWRTTGVVGEGCCILVLEPEDSSRRGYSFISGYGFANDNGELCGGMVDSARIAFGHARLNINRVEVINAWGPGHKQVDRGEALAMASVFGSKLNEVAVHSLKGAIGTPLGAAGAIQTAAASLAQINNIIPPTVNWEHPDPSCAFNLSNRRRELSHSTTLINSHGLGGTNSSLVLERC